MSDSLLRIVSSLIAAFVVTLAGGPSWACVIAAGIGWLTAAVAQLMDSRQ